MNSITSIHVDSLDRLVISECCDLSGSDAPLSLACDSCQGALSIFGAFGDFKLSPSSTTHPQEHHHQNIAMTEAMASDIDIEDRIRRLPQELQDLILDFTLIPSARTVNINESYRPPWQLRINRRSREIVAMTYYRDTTFIIDSQKGQQPAYPQYRVSVLQCWLSSLRRKDRRLISHIHAIFDQDSYINLYKPYRGRDSWLNLAAHEAGDWLQLAQELRVSYPSAIVSAIFGYKTVEGTSEELQFNHEEEAMKFRIALATN